MKTNSYMLEKKDGRESEWNEANLKSERLHEAQRLINYFKMNLLGVTDGKYNYLWYAKNVEILMGEGRSKYNETEYSKLIEISKNIFRKM